MSEIQAFKREKWDIKAKKVEKMMQHFVIHRLASWSAVRKSGKHQVHGAILPILPWDYSSSKENACAKPRPICGRGTEFVNWRRMEVRSRCGVCFADRYCAWQKGTNENLNGLLREFYPKGRNLERVSEKTLKKNLALINARPKKVLHYQKPVDLFNFFLSKCCT